MNYSKFDGYRFRFVYALWMEIRHPLPLRFEYTITLKKINQFGLNFHWVKMYFYFWQRAKMKASVQLLKILSDIYTNS